MEKQLIIAYPLGFCAGVRRAVDTVEAVLKELKGEHIYVYNEIVHNTTVVENLRQQGVNFVKSVEQVPTGSTLIFSAHGVAKQVEDEAAARNLNVIDATCPLVASLHRQAQRLAEAGEYVVLVGHPNHPEVIGTLGQLPEHSLKLVAKDAQQVAELPDLKPNQKVKVLVQTTLNQAAVSPVFNALQERFKEVELVGSHCYATENRQNAVRHLASCCEHILVIGSAHSSNSRQLCEVATLSGCSASLVDTPSEIDAQMLEGINRLGVSAGASAPPELIAATLKLLKKYNFTQIEQLHVAQERTDFPLPQIEKKLF